MKRKSFYNSPSASCIAAALLFGFGAPAVAADAAADAAALPKAAASAAADTDIVVTGSRLKRPALESPVPVTSIRTDQLLSGGSLSLGDQLNQLPGLRSTFSQSNSERFIGTSGLNELDLRGLGTARTLVLVDGHRHVASSIGALAVDTNDIPPDLLERVDVVTGGNSAIYGSDAVAGVVNFIMKKNYQGVQLTGQAGASGRGDRGEYYVSAVAGQNFAGGRGNIAVAAELSHTDALYNTQRDDETGAYSGRHQFNLSTNTADPTNFSTQQLFYTGVRSSTISDGGLVTSVCNAANVANIARCRADKSQPAAPLGFSQRYVFDQSGNLVLSNPTLDFREITNGGSNNTIGGGGSTLLNTGQLDPLNERVSIDVVAHYDFSELLKISTDTKYVRVKTNQEGQPSFSTGFGALTANISCSNGFLTAQNLAVLQSIGRCATPTSTFSDARFNVDFGGRGELTTREVFRTVETLSGTFKNGWSYEVSANFGTFVFNTRSLNNLQVFNMDGTNGPFVKALDAVKNAAGQVVCRVNLVTITDPSCVPINTFGNGAPSQAALNYVNVTATSNGRNKEFDATAFLRGDFGPVRLAAGPISWVLGAEYRSEAARSLFDPLTASGATFLNAIQPFNPPTLISKEGFVEVNLPLLKNLPFAKDLTLHGAGRLSNYNTSTGTVYSYNGDITYAPSRDIRFRAGYSRSVRAPTQSDLFATQSQNFAQIQDPCDTLFVGGGVNRAANCKAAGIDTTTFINAPARAQSTGFLSGGNATLTAEKSDSYTLGTIITPRFMPGFSFTADYYNIKIKQAIANLGAQQIINLCYDLPTTNNQYCPLVFRDPTTKLFLPIATLSAPVNFAVFETSGLDFEMNYTHKMGNGDNIDLRALATYVFVKNFHTDPTNPSAFTKALGTLGDAQLNAQASIDYKHDVLSLHYDARLIGKSLISSYEATLTPTGNVIYISNRYPPIVYHNISATVAVNKRFSIKVGSDNVFDRLPPYGLRGVTANDGAYDNVGRTFYARVVVKY